MRVLSVSTEVSAKSEVNHHIRLSLRIMRHRNEEKYALEYTLFDHAVHISNTQAGSPLFRSCSACRAIASEILSACRRIDPACLAGRTIHGLAFEIYLHYLLSCLFRSGRLYHAVTVTDAGALFSGDPGYDGNAWVFEGPSGLFRIVLHHFHRMQDPPNRLS